MAVGGIAADPDLRHQQALSRLAAAHLGPDDSRHRVDRRCVVHPTLAGPGPNGIREGFTAARLSGKDKEWMNVTSSALGLVSAPSAHAPKRRIPLRRGSFGRGRRRWRILMVGTSLLLPQKNAPENLEHFRQSEIRLYLGLGEPPLWPPPPACPPPWPHRVRATQSRSGAHPWSSTGVTAHTVATAHSLGRDARRHRTRWRRKDVSRVLSNIQRGMRVASCVLAVDSMVSVPPAFVALPAVAGL